MFLLPVALGALLREDIPEISENVRRVLRGRMRKLLMIPAALVGVEPPAPKNSQ
jgi:hypothetical protein